MYPSLSEKGDGLRSSKARFLEMLIITGSSQELETSHEIRLLIARDLLPCDLR